MERNYSTPNISVEQRLTLAIIQVVRHLSMVINRIITKLENQSEWFADDILYSQQKVIELHHDLDVTQDTHQSSAQSKAVALDETPSPEEHPFLIRKRKKAQLNLDYLLAISG